MKTSLLLDRLVYTQSNFRMLDLKFTKSITKVNVLLRQRYNLSLVVKVLILLRLFNHSVIIKKEKANFLRIEGINHLNLINFSLLFNKTFVLTETKLNLLDLIRSQRLENVYDFFNLPVKFQFQQIYSLRNFLRLSVKSF